ncbi:MAG: type II toxin-antitoxin system HicA family toxin [Actinomycetota bacterium]|nr:type II toxin-antitoxin system HicA family toxin [Actinomycetota bacterium]
MRISGSHHVMRHPDGRTVAVPVHAGRDMEKGTLRNVLAINGMTPEELWGCCETTPLRDQGPTDVP